MTPEQRAEWEATMLPDRNVDCRELAKKQLKQENLPRRITAMLSVEIDLLEFITDELEARKDSQTRSMNGPWRYMYDPLIITRENLVSALLDSARWELTRKDGIDVDEILWGDSSKLDPEDDSSPVSENVEDVL
jgi:hypothetical protein